MGSRDENVIDYIFRARNANQVSQAARDIREGFEGMEPAAESAGDSVDKFEQQFQDWLNTTERVEQQSRGLFASLKSEGVGVVAAGFVAATAAIEAFRAGLDKLRDTWDFTINKAAAQEDAIVRLENAMRSAGTFSVQASRDFQEFAAAQQQLTASGDESTLALGALIAQIGKLRGEQLERATVAALDMQAALGKTSQEVGIFLGKLAQGEAGSLTEIGIVIDQTLPKSEKFLAGLEAIEAAFGGTAQATVRTYSGSIQQLSNAWGDLGEALGQAVLPQLTRAAQLATGVVQDVTRIIQEMHGTTQATLPEMAQIFATQTNAIRGSVGGMRRELEEARDLLADTAVSQLRLEIKTGDLDQVVQTLGQLDEVVAESAARGNREFEQMVARMQAAVREEFAIRIKVEAAQAGAELANLADKLRPEATLDVLLRGTQAFEDAKKLAAGAREEIERPLVFGGGVVQNIDLSALRNQVTEAQEALDQLKERRDRLLLVGDAIGARAVDIDITLAVQKLDDLQRDYEEARQTLEKEIKAGNVTFTFGAAGSLQQQAKDFVEQLGPAIEQEKLEVVAAAKLKVDTAASTDELRAFLADLEKLTTDAAAKAQSDPTDRNRALRDALQQANEVAKAAAIIRAEVLKLEEAADATGAALDRTVALFVGLQKLTGSTSLDDIKTEELVRGTTDATEAADKLRETIAKLGASPDIDELRQAYHALTAAIEASDDGVHTLDDDLQQAMIDGRARVLELIELLDPLERERIIKLRIEAKKAKDDADKESDDIAKILEKNLADISLEAPGEIFDAFWERMQTGSEAAFESIGKGFSALIDHMIRELARLAAFQIFKFLFLTAGTGAPIVPDPTGLGYGNINKAGDGTVGGPSPGTPTTLDGTPLVRQFVGAVARPLEEVAQQIQVQQALLLAQTPQLIQQSAARAVTPFVTGEREPIVQNINVRAIDSADAERWFRDGPGSRALAALAATGRF